MKIKNLKISSEGGSSFGGKGQKYKSKVKSLIISSHCEPRPFVKINFYLEKTKFSAIKKFICFLM
jgi:hypothetical protein